MSAMSRTTPQDQIGIVRAFADELTRTVDVARALAEAGRAIDLAGLDDQIGLLCAKSLDLQPDEGRRMRPRLIVLAASIEALSNALQKAVPWPSMPPPY
jgi:hypothetical protein